MGLPTLTVVVPNYNHAKLLPRALEAIFIQSVPALEVIVVDDASADNSVEVIQEYARRYPTLRLVRNAKNEGVNYNLNLGLAQAKGDFIFFPAADDKIMPGLFEKSLRLLAEHPKAGLSCAIAEWREEFDNKLSWQIPPDLAENPSCFSPEEMVKLGKQRKLYIIASNCFMRTDKLREVDGFISELHWHSDWFANYVIGFRYGICFVPEVLSVAYLLKDSFFQSRDMAKHDRVLRKLLELLGSAQYADVMPRIREAGELALFGKPMLALLRQPEYRHFINATFRRKMFLRRAELLAKNYFPGWLARLCIKLFYSKAPSRSAAN